MKSLVSIAASVFLYKRVGIVEEIVTLPQKLCHPKTITFHPSRHGGADGA